jgi:hypothetical protein
MPEGVWGSAVCFIHHRTLDYRVQHFASFLPADKYPEVQVAPLPQPERAPTPPPALTPTPTGSELSFSEAGDTTRPDPESLPPTNSTAWRCLPGHRTARQQKASPQSCL